MYQCPMCDKQSDQLRGFSIHLVRKHKVSVEEAYVKYKLQGARPLCRCGCGAETSFSTWEVGFNEFVLGHNGRLECLPPEEAEEISRKRREALTGRPGWSKGLTSETSEVIARRSERISEVLQEKFATGKLVAKNKGQTKHTSDSVRKTAEGVKAAYASGKRVAWAKGKTKYTDPKVARMAAKVKMTVSESSLRQRLDALKRLTPEEITSRLEAKAPNLEILSDLREYTCDQDVNLQFKCKSCATTSTRSLASALTNRCFTCDPLGSQAQVEVRDFIKRLLPHEDVQLSVRSVIQANRKLEADVYVPSRKLVVEYDGLYFHSSVHKGKHDHEAKTELFKAEGLTVLHVFEDEWRDKRSLVQSMIRHRLGLTERRIYARQCQIVKLSAAERRHFFEENHIDGDVSASAAWGLTFEEKLIAALSVRIPFHAKYKNDALEVARSATLKDHLCVGGVAKLTKQAELYTRSLGKTALMTYVDLRHGTGESYIKAGFEFSSKTVPRFWWTDFNNRYNRFKFRADKVRGLTEEQVAVENNVHKIWGCSNLLLVKHLDL